MWLAVESASFNWGTACTWLLGLLSSLKYILFVLQINLCTQKKMCLLCIYLSLISGFSPWRRISHKFAFVYLLTGCSSRPFSFENICSLSWWYCWHSSKKNFILVVFFFNLYFWTGQHHIFEYFRLTALFKNWKLFQKWLKMCLQNYFHFPHRKWKETKLLSLST